jgi:putative nucleotidyltransferase with HDIG domain
MADPKPSSSEAEDSTPLLPLDPRNLRLGMYVHLNCSWFLHPFPRQHFLLTSENQIATIRGLGLSSLLLDPARSTPESWQGASPVSSSTGCAQLGAEAQDQPAESSADAINPTWLPATDGPRSGRSNAGFQESFRQAAQTYEKAAQHFKQAISDLRTGSEEGLAVAKMVTNQLAHVLLDDRLAGSIAGLLDSPKVEERDVLHALNVSCLAMMVGRQFALSLEDLKILGIGALLHDIGEQELPPELLARRDLLSPEEAELYRKHPALGATLLSSLSEFPQEALRMIESHHERIDGSGYPDHLKEEYLSLFTRIVMVVDEYDILINHRDPERRMTPADALSYLYRTSQTTLAPDVIAGLVRTLTVYPPGTIVELVNGAYALVLNINRQARMKPLVLLYAPQGDTPAPVLVDLMVDRSRVIARRPPLGELPTRVRDYLNMPRWTSYFLATTAERTR